MKSHETTLWEEVVARTVSRLSSLATEEVVANWRQRGRIPENLQTRYSLMVHEFSELDPALRVGAVVIARDIAFVSHPDIVRPYIDAATIDEAESVRAKAFTLISDIPNTPQ
jgi:hypothetical protein